MIELPTIPERDYRLAFRASLVLKGLGAIAELAGSVFVYFMNTDSAVRFVTSITAEELSEDPRDFVANYLLTLAHRASISSQHFIALYLVSHGIIKLFLVIALLKNKLWAYPLSMAVFFAFIAYQMIRFASTGSLWLLALTLFDLVLVWLTWHEYRLARHLA